jgi:hypothetical protein
MRRAFLIFMGLFFSSGVLAELSLMDQISAVNQAHQQQKETEKAEAEAARLAAEKEAARKAAEAARQRRAAEALKRAELEARLADKQRDQDYEDELRRLELEERKLKLSEKKTDMNLGEEKERIRIAEMKARSERVDEFIDQDLKSRAATADVIQSQADANRNISEGAKSYMTSAGKAEEKEASRLFK